MTTEEKLDRMARRAQALAERNREYAGIEYELGELIAALTHDDPNVRTALVRAVNIGRIMDRAAKVVVP